MQTPKGGHSFGYARNIGMPCTIAQLPNAGLPDVIDVEISSSSLDGANDCILAYEQCHLTDKVQLEAVA